MKDELVKIIKVNLSLAKYESFTQINFTNDIPDFSNPKIQAVILSETLKKVLTKEVQKEFTEIIIKDLLITILNNRKKEENNE